jgi:hypothetical protein
VREMRLLNLGCKYYHLWTGMLLYADDMVLLEVKPEKLQVMLDVLEAYSRRWRFTISVSKTKTMVFGGTSRWQWTIYGHPIERVRRFKYLGIVFEEGGRWRSMSAQVAAKARRGWCSLLSAGVGGQGLGERLQLSSVESAHSPSLDIRG